MITLLRAIPIFVVMLTSTAAEAALLISEGFEGPNTLKSWDGSAWQSVSNFVGSGFNNGVIGGSIRVTKETVGCHGGNQCARMHGEFEGGTSELWTNQFNPQPHELWFTWWEKLSSSYDINEGHKWFFVSGPHSPTWTYLSWQTWSGATNNDLSSRVYNSGSWDSTGQNFIFAPTTSTPLPINTWYQYKAHVKLNSIGQSDGAWQIWIKKDGVNWTTLWDLQNKNNIRTAGGTIGIHGLQFSGTRAHPGDGQPDSFGTKWIDDIKIGTTEADVDSGGGSNSIAAPNNLHFN